MSREKKILIVDDSNVVLMTQKMILANVGRYTLITASDGEEAVAKATNESPDLLLLDVIMPKMTGFEVLKKLRSQESTANIPIIMVTTRGESENMETGYASGCNDYVTKPVDSTELLAKVEALLGE